MTEIFDNIRSIYDFSEPVEPLRPFIEFFSESSGERTASTMGGKPFIVEMFPSWTPTFWINLGAPYLVSTPLGQRRIGRDDDILLLRDSITTRHNNPADHIFTVKFFPGGLESILGFNQTQCARKIVPLREILPPQLLFQLRTAGSFENRTVLFQDYFLSRFGRKRPRDHYIRLVSDSIGLYEDNGMQPNTGELAERLFLHSRSINRYFHRVIGLPPKRYLSILRARAALTRYLDTPEDFLPTEFGYYDKSHFYKAIHQFTGRPLAVQL